MVEIRDISVEYEDLPQSLRDAVDYWQALRGDRIGPKWREIDMLKLPLQLLPTTVVVDCFDDENGDNFRYRFYGSGLRNVHNVELTGKTPDDVPVPALSKYIKNEFVRVKSTKAPLFSVYGTDTADGFGGFLSVVRLPLSEDTEHVTSILAVIRYMQHDLALTNMFNAMQKSRASSLNASPV